VLVDELLPLSPGCESGKDPYFIELPNPEQDVKTYPISIM